MIKTTKYNYVEILKRHYGYFWQNCYRGKSITEIARMFSYRELKDMYEEIADAESYGFSV